MHIQGKARNIVWFLTGQKSEYEIIFLTRKKKEEES